MSITAIPGGIVENITKSLTAMALAVLAAVVYVLGAAFRVAAYASVTSVSPAATHSLIRTSEWSRFTGGVLALVAVCMAGWQLIERRAWEGAWEVGAAAIGTLLITIGFLISAISVSSSPPSLPASANVVIAAGFGVWALLLLARAARRSLAEQRLRSEGVTQPPRLAVLWLIAAGGVAVFAVGTGFTPDVTSKGLGITFGILQAIGVVIVFGALAAAPARGRLLSHALPLVLAGLAVLAAAYLAFAIMAGVVFGSGFSVTGLRVGYSIAIGIQLAAVGVLGWAAWSRVRELSAPPPA